MTAAAGQARPRRADATKAALRREIKAGRFQAAEILPGERQLAEWLQVSRSTLRQALADLIADGLLVQRQGLGTFIVRTTADPARTTTEQTTLGPLADIGLNGPILRSVELENGLFTPSSEDAMVFGLGAGDLVRRLARIIFADAGPIAIERTAVPAVLLPEAMGSASFLLGALAEHGHRPVRKLQRLRVAELSATDAARLDTGARAAAIELSETVFLAEGRCCALTHALYRADRLDAVFSTDLRERDAAPGLR